MSIQLTITDILFTTRCERLGKDVVHPFCALSDRYIFMLNAVHDHLKAFLSVKLAGKLPDTVYKLESAN